MKAITENRIVGEKIMTAVMKRRMARKRRGFTLVEVIVVLVILAILAAIAIPALTGYIDKAESRKWIAQAHNIYTAARAVVDEAYATGEFNTNSNFAEFAEKGEQKMKTKIWTLGGLGGFATDPNASRSTPVYVAEFANRGRDLISDTKAWAFSFVGSSTSTVFDTTGFWCVIYPGGTATGDPIILVTYQMKRAADSIKGSFQNFENDTSTTDYYDSSVGYEVYYQFTKK